MKSSNPLEKIMPYALVGVFTLLFGGVTFLLWSQAAKQLETSAPNVGLLILFSLPLPFLGYWVYMSAQGANAVFNVRTYSGTQVLALIFWVMAVWLWLQAYIWYTLVSDATFLLLFLLLLIPYASMMRGFADSSPERAAHLGAPAESWLKWMGNGELHRGTLVLLVVIFWSILFWNWPNPDVRTYPTVLTIPIWGLLTIFGLVAIRSIFFRQTNLPNQPGQEVSAGDPKKSPAK